MPFEPHWYNRMEKSVELTCPSWFISAHLLTNGAWVCQKYNRMEKSVEFTIPSKLKSAPLQIPAVGAWVVATGGPLKPPPPPPPPPPLLPEEVGVGVGDETDSVKDLEELEDLVP